MYLLCRCSLIQGQGVQPNLKVVGSGGGIGELDVVPLEDKNQACTYLGTISTNMVYYVWYTMVWSAS